MNAYEHKLWWRHLVTSSGICLRGKYRITGIFCGCLIFAEFCGSIQIAEIKNRKIFQSGYNDEIVSEVIVQSRIFRCLSGTVEFNICMKRNAQLYNVHPDMRLSFKRQAVFEIKSVLVIVDYENIPWQPFRWVFNTFSIVGDRWKSLSFKMSILNVLSNWFGRQMPDHGRVCKCCFHTNYQLKEGVHNDNTFTNTVIDCLVSPLHWVC